MHHFTAKDIYGSVDYPALIGALKIRYCSGCEEPKRTHYDYDWGESGLPSTLLSMSAWSEQVISVKILNLVSGKEVPGHLPKGLCLLFDRTSGVLLATFDSAAITACRTAAAAALATMFLAPPEAQSLAMIGAGQLAPAMIRAIHAVRPIQRVKIWSPSGTSAEKLAQAMASEQIRITATKDLHAMYEGDIICAATPSLEPLITYALLRKAPPGQHINLVGSFRPDMREAGDLVMANALIVLDSEIALEESGDLIQPVQSGTLTREAIAGTLTDLCKRGVDFKNRGSALTLYKSVGHALQDLVAMEYFYTARFGKV